MTKPMDIRDEREGNARIRQAHKLIHDELQRASDREQELRWEPIRAALTILEIGAVRKTETTYYS